MSVRAAGWPPGRCSRRTGSRTARCRARAIRWPSRNMRTMRSSAAVSRWPVTTGARVASQAAAPASGPVSQPCPAAAAARQVASAPDAPGMLRSWAKVMWTWAWVGCPARSGSIPEAISRRHASSSASWRRWAAVRLSSGPAFFPKDSSTAASAAAQPGARSPLSRPAPRNVTSSHRPRLTEPVTGIGVRAVPAAALVHLLRQPAQISQLRPAPRSASQDRIRVIAAASGKPVAPAAQFPGPRRGDLPVG